MPYSLPCYRSVSAPVYHVAGQYATDLFTAEAVNMIRSHNTSSPLFLYLAHLAVHSANPYAPLQAPREDVDRFPYIEDERRRTFAGQSVIFIARINMVNVALCCDTRTFEWNIWFTFIITFIYLF